MTFTFQRARQPEQVAARRVAIKGAARAMLAEKALSDITVRDIGERVGLAKSNVLRYFDSREAIFLELLEDEWRSWLNEVDRRLGRPRQRKTSHASEIRFATIIADSLAERAELCELLSAMAGVLERNISTEFARAFKTRCAADIGELSQFVARHLPWLSREFTESFPDVALPLTAGLYPFSAPTESVRVAMAELNFPDPKERFNRGLRTGLVTWMIGAAVQSGS